jgi:predicted MFS family arabinose efflux permease
MRTIAGERAAEWRAHWPMALTAFVGMSMTSVAIHSTGLVIAPLTDEFGWSRTEITAGITLAALLMIPLSPFFGALIDRFGVRRIAVPGTVLASLSLAGIALANGSTLQWLMLWACFGLASLFIKTTIWTAAITGAFYAGRSMAISVTLCGTAFTAIAVPPLMQGLTDSLGWREGYLLMAALWGIPLIALTWFFLFDAHDKARMPLHKNESPNAQPSEPSGLSVAEAARSFALWRIGLATLIMLLLGSSLVVHKVPLLSEFGISRSNAAWLASLFGVASVVGKLVTGWMMERWDAGAVGSATNAATALALILLLEPFRTPTTIVIALMMVGYAGGTKLQLCVYLTGVYAGMRNYGKIFGVMSSVVAVAGGLGPLAGGAIYDAFASYDGLLMIGIPASVISALLILRLGEYPEWSRALVASSSKSAVATA